MSCQRRRDTDSHAGWDVNPARTAGGGIQVVVEPGSVIAIEWQAGVLDLALRAEARQEHLVRGVLNKELTRRTGLGQHASAPSVRTAIRAAAEEPSRRAILRRRTADMLRLGKWRTVRVRPRALLVDPSRSINVTKLGRVARVSPRCVRGRYG